MIYLDCVCPGEGAMIGVLENRTLLSFEYSQFMKGTMKEHTSPLHFSDKLFILTPRYPSFFFAFP